MSEMMELAETFASASTKECVVSTLRMTQTAICAEMIEPAGGVELKRDDMEYVTGEWGWFANHNLKYTCIWSDPSGVNWLLGRAGIADSIAITGSGTSIIVTLGALSAPATAGLSAAFSAIALGAMGIYGGILGNDAKDKAILGMQYMGQERNYKVFENTVMWNTVVNGYDVEPW